MIKTLGIYFSNHPDQDGHFFDAIKEHDDFDMIYCMTSKLLLEHGIRTVYLAGPESYVGMGKFSRYYEPILDENRFRLVDELIEPDMVLDKGGITFNDGFLNAFNSASFIQLGCNKYSQSVLAADFSPKTVLISKPTDTEKALAEISTDKVVVKPLDGYGGTGIIVANKKDLKMEQFPAIAQEFIESAAGVDGLVKGRHDVRLFILDGEIVLGAVRQPKAGGYLANTHQGGTYRQFGVEQVNAELAKFSEPIRKIFDAQGGVFYSIDFMYDGKKWYLIEMNDMPGMPDLSIDEDGSAKYFFEKFAEYLKK